MEATWLVAVVTVPIFFNIYSSRIFEPDKLTLMRSLALVILVAWIIKLFDQGNPFAKSDKPWHRQLWDIPLVPQVIALALVYLFATIFSVSPRVSFWGSYQRLQGTYTTIGYLIIFAALVGNLRRPAQVGRLISTVIFASLPVGLYGILQRFEIDPVPWGGNVSNRIASNMGNSIFVAAYLIMAVPLTLGRIVDSFSAILRDDKGLVTQVARGTVYVFVFAIQVIAIYLSGSRGPTLGLLAGGFFLFLFLSLFWKQRWLTISVVVLAIAGGAFLLLLNIPGGPLETVRNQPWVGRFGEMLDTNQRTSQVRIFIWKGASELISPHDPLIFPDGSEDTFNFLRPIFGYGPESMYVAYNPFYPPELGNLESRNASPDRSHNETWDSLVITGGAGLLAYLALFSSVFYYGLSWLGMIRTKKQGYLFLGLLLGGGVAAAAGFIVYAGIEFFGVGLPFGMLLGLVLYLPMIALFGRYEAPTDDDERKRALILMVLLGAIIAHFVEIHFGIAIAATRTHFWVYTALLLLVGYILPREGVMGQAPVVVDTPAADGAKTRKRAKRRGTRRRAPAQTMLSSWLRQALIGGGVIGVLLATLGFAFITNSTRTGSIFEIVWLSLTRLPNKDNAVSFGVLALLLTPLIIASVGFTSETLKDKPEYPWLKSLGVTLGVGFGIGILFWFWHASSLAALTRPIPNVAGIDAIIAQSRMLEGLLTKYYLYMFLLIVVLARLVLVDWPSRGAQRPGTAVLAVPVAIILLFTAVSYTNLRIIHADIAFKVAEPFSRGGTVEEWQAAIELYQRAQDLAPSEDHYYLFLGRGYLELARLLQSDDPEASEDWMEQAEEDLLRAQAINPLNTDHTANLARLFRFWSSLSSETELRQQRARQSETFYNRALELSPQNAVIRNELAILQLQLLNQTDQAISTLNQTLEIDPYYDGTHAVLADYYSQSAQRASEEEARTAQYELAIFHYEQAIDLTDTYRRNVNKTTRYNYRVALAGVFTQLNELDTAVEWYIDALEFANNNQRWRVEDTIARVYIQLDEYELARTYAVSALENAPDSDKAGVQQVLDFINQNQSAP